MGDDHSTDSAIGEWARRLVDRILPMGAAAVAFSGGVDSAVVAKAAKLALGDRALAVTGVSPSLASGESKIAERIAAQIGIRHCLIPTRETERSDYRRNDAHRCYYCKSELYAEMSRLVAEEGVSVILSGANKDDLSDYRPGLAAASEYQVRHPLAECEIDKATVRELARWWGIEIWNKPASPCLSSRIAYGVEVSDERLRRIDAAEQYLKRRGYGPLRVRLHEGELARIELPVEQIERIASEPERAEVAMMLGELGFRYIALDLTGFRSGGLNALLQVSTPLRSYLDAET